MNKLSLLCFAILLIANLQGQSNKFVVLEEFSTAPCGACPDGAVVADELLGIHENLIVITHHAGFGVDSMTIPESVELAAYTNSAPTAAINRKLYDDETVYLNASGMVWSRQRWDSVITSQLMIASPVNLDLSYTYDPDLNSIIASMDFTFTEELDFSLIHTNFLIVEDSVIGMGQGYDQVNYYNNVSNHPMYQRGDPIVGYEHRHVVRKMTGGTWGTKTTEELIIGENYNIETVIPIDDAWDINQLSLIGWVNYYDEADRNKHEILNAYEIKIETNLVNVSLLTTSGIKIHPNPASEQLTINYEGNRNSLLAVQVFNQLGQLVLEKEIAQSQRNGNQINLNTKRLEPGIYYLNLLGEEGLYKSLPFVKK